MKRSRKQSSNQKDVLPYEKADHLAIDPDTFERVM